MGTILDSVNNLSEKLGVTAREQTIKDQLDLCVERLGGEGNSVDIAESANKFADKEDGTATFTTKTITENGTYDATDDGASGYSSVTVDVSGGATFTKVHSASLGRTYFNGQTTEYFDPLYIYNNDSDEIEISENNSADGIFIILNPVKKISFTGLGSSPHIIFTPANNYDGIYSLTSGNKYDFTGDQVVANDGKTYSALVNFSGSSYTIKRFDNAFPSEIE